VPPLTFARCSQGGKTRTLHELFHWITKDEALQTNAIYVTFQDYSAVTPEDVEDPLQALCQRIVFAITRNGEHHNQAELAHAYESFRQKNYYINEFDLAKWLGMSRIVLLVDDFHIFAERGAVGSDSAAAMCRFIDAYFLSHPGRYLVFTS
jgi:hypothetical protein